MSYSLKRHVKYQNGVQFHLSSSSLIYLKICLITYLMMLTWNGLLS